MLREDKRGYQNNTIFPFSLLREKNPYIPSLQSSNPKYTLKNKSYDMMSKQTLQKYIESGTYASKKHTVRQKKKIAI